jgi:hypothetical protein
MPSWGDRTQLVRDTRVTALEELDQLTAEAPADDEPSLEAIEQTRSILNVAGDYLEGSNPQLVSNAMVGRLSAALGSVVNWIQQQRAQLAEGTPPVWENSSPADQILEALASWQEPGLPTAVSEVWRELERIPALVVERTEAANQRVAEVKALANAALADVVDRVAAIQTESAQRLTELGARVDEFDARIGAQVELVTQQVARMEAALASNAVQFKAAQDSMESEFKAAQDTRLNDHSGLIKRIDSEAAAQLATWKEQAELLLGELDRNKEDAKNIVGVIARTGMTGGYQQYGKDEKEAADRWRRIAMWMAVISVAFLTAAVVATALQGHPGAADITGRFVLAAALGGVATYAAQQSSAHRRRASRARSLELSLASIGPYLESLPAEARDAILVNFAYVFFKPDDPAEEASSLGPAGLTVARRAFGGQIDGTKT